MPFRLAPPSLSVCLSRSSPCPSPVAAAAALILRGSLYPSQHSQLYPETFPIFRPGCLVSHSARRYLVLSANTLPLLTRGSSVLS
jgi:hypothetical protein